MIKIIKQGYVKPQYITECNHCHTKFTFNDDDTEYANLLYSKQQYINCPYCGTELFDRLWNVYREAK